MHDLPGLLKLLALEPHPQEGGYFVETYRSAESWPAGLSSDRTEAHSLATAIYFLLTPEAHSSLHRLPTDEIFHFYLGDPVEMLLLKPDRTGEVRVLGTDLGSGMRPQVVVPGGTWQGSRLAPGGRFALLGTTMAPGFVPSDYEPGDAEVLAGIYGKHLTEILALAPRRR
jgi:uncharacterized protein